MVCETAAEQIRAKQQNSQSDDSAVNAASSGAAAWQGRTPSSEGGGAPARCSCGVDGAGAGVPPTAPATLGLGGGPSGGEGPGGPSAGRGGEGRPK